MNAINVQGSPEHDRSQAEEFVNDVFSNVCRAMHEAAKEAGVVSDYCYKPKPYWCPNLSVEKSKEVLVAIMGGR